MDEDTRLFRIWLVGCALWLALAGGMLAGIVFLIRALLRIA